MSERAGLSTDQLLPELYANLRALACSYLKGERAGQALQPTELVHEAYVRLTDIRKIAWQGKTHFFAMAATQMRRILVERARAAATAKRGAGWQRITLKDGDAMTPYPSLDLLALDEALSELTRLSPRQARVSELRIFGGLTAAEMAQFLDTSERTVKRDWTVARAWLGSRLTRFPEDRS